MTEKTFEEILKERGITNLKVIITFSELINRFYLEKKEVKDAIDKRIKFIKSGEWIISRNIQQFVVTDLKELKKELGLDKGDKE